MYNLIIRGIKKKKVWFGKNNYYLYSQPKKLNIHAHQPPPPSSLSSLASTTLVAAALFSSLSASPPTLLPASTFSLQDGRRSGWFDSESVAGDELLPVLLITVVVGLAVVMVAVIVGWALLLLMLLPFPLLLLLLLLFVILFPVLLLLLMVVVVLVDDDKGCRSGSGSYFKGVQQIIFFSDSSSGICKIVIAKHYNFCINGWYQNTFD